jgi:hypothetical protein
VKKWEVSELSAASDISSSACILGTSWPIHKGHFFSEEARSFYIQLRAFTEEARSFYIRLRASTDKKRLPPTIFNGNDLDTIKYVFLRLFRTLVYGVFILSNESRFVNISRELFLLTRTWDKAQR